MGGKRGIPRALSLKHTLCWDSSQPPPLSPRTHQQSPHIPSPFFPLFDAKKIPVPPPFQSILCSPPPPLQTAPPEALILHTRSSSTPYPFPHPPPCDLGPDFSSPPSAAAAAPSSLSNRPPSSSFLLRLTSALPKTDPGAWRGGKGG